MYVKMFFFLSFQSKRIKCWGFLAVKKGGSAKKANKTPCVVYKTPCVVYETPCVVYETPCVVYETPCVVYETPCVVYKTH
jgi:hypothetical protein